MKRVLLLLATCLALGGCGAPRGTAIDAGAEARGGLLAFEVTALVGNPGALQTFVSRFTLVLDRANGRAIVGGGGQAKVIPVTTADGRTFRVSTAFAVGQSEARCGSALRLVFETAELTLDGGHLTGHAKGHLAQSGMGFEDSPFDGTLDGTPDTAPPFLISPPGQSVTDPLSDFVIWPSEPLPETATARLISSTDAVFTLAPNFAEGNPRLVASFSKPTITLPPGESFRVVLDAEADFADNRTIAGDALRLARFDEVPLVPADGFESVTGTVLAGAAVIRTPGTAIAGAASLFISERNSLAKNGLGQTPQLLIQMTVPPGATKLTFSYRALSYNRNGPQAGTIHLGSLAREPSPVVPIPSPATTTKLMLGTLPVDASELTTMDVPLPEAIGSDVVILFRSPSVLCGDVAQVGEVGLLLDDLRIE